jgi:hypothetical protein
MKESIICTCIFIILIQLVSCKKETFYGKYNAQSPSVYSSIEFLQHNIARLNSDINKTSIITKYEKRGKYLFVRDGNRNEGFELINSNSIKGGKGIVGNECVIYNKSIITTDTSENDLVAVLPNYELTDSPVYDYIETKEMVIRCSDQKIIDASFGLGISIENIDENKKIVSENQKEIEGKISTYFFNRTSNDIRNDKENTIRYELMGAINKVFVKPIIKEIVINKFFIEK